MQIFSGFSGPGFLVFYAIMLATCFLASMVMAAALRPAGNPRRVDDVEEIAVLAGGTERHVAATLSSLFASGTLERAGRDRLRVARQLDQGTGAERAIARKVGDFSVSEARKTLEDHGRAVQKRLMQQGLLLTPGELARLGLVSLLPFAALLVLGVYRLQAGLALGRPVGFLVGLLVLTVVLAIVRFARTNPRTRAGNAALHEMEAQSSRMRRAPQGGEASYAVALFGTGVLIGTPWEPLHAVQRAGGGDTGSHVFSGDSGGDSGDSGGGGCGGGCGGCGG